MTEQLRYGVIGTGMMGIEHINNLLHLPGATVTAVADPHAESLDWAQLAVGLDTPLAKFSNHHELLASGLCDAVVIATPNFTHHEVLLDVLRSSLHVHGAAAPLLQRRRTLQLVAHHVAADVVGMEVGGEHTDDA